MGGSLSCLKAGKAANFRTEKSGVHIKLPRNRKENGKAVEWFSN